MFWAWYYLWRWVVEEDRCPLITHFTHAKLKLHRVCDASLKTNMKDALTCLTQVELVTLIVAAWVIINFMRCTCALPAVTGQNGLHPLSLCACVYFLTLWGHKCVYTVTLWFPYQSLILRLKTRFNFRGRLRLGSVSSGSGKSPGNACKSTSCPPEVTETRCVCTLMTTPIMGSVRIRPGWGVGQRSMSLQAVNQIHKQQSEFTLHRSKLSQT